MSQENLPLSRCQQTGSCAESGASAAPRDDAQRAIGWQPREAVHSCEVLQLPMPPQRALVRSPCGPSGQTSDWEPRSASIRGRRRAACSPLREVARRPPGSRSRFSPPARQGSALSRERESERPGRQPEPARVATTVERAAARRPPAEPKARPRGRVRAAPRAAAERWVHSAVEAGRVGPRTSRRHRPARRDGRTGRRARDRRRGRERRSGLLRRCGPPS
jgi:hypothetical protein